MFKLTYLISFFIIIGIKLSSQESLNKKIIFFIKEPGYFSTYLENTLNNLQSTNNNRLFSNVTNINEIISNYESLLKLRSAYGIISQNREWSKFTIDSKSIDTTILSLILKHDYFLVSNPLKLSDDILELQLDLYKNENNKSIKILSNSKLFSITSKRLYPEINHFIKSIFPECNFRPIIQYKITNLPILENGVNEIPIGDSLIINLSDSYDLDGNYDDLEFRLNQYFPNRPINYTFTEGIYTVYLKDTGYFKLNIIAKDKGDLEDTFELELNVKPKIIIKKYTPKKLKITYNDFLFNTYRDTMLTKYIKYKNKSKDYIDSSIIYIIKTNNNFSKEVIYTYGKYKSAHIGVIDSILKNNYYGLKEILIKAKNGKMISNIISYPLKYLKKNVIFYELFFDMSTPSIIDTTFIHALRVGLNCNVRVTPSINSYVKFSKINFLDNELNKFKCLECLIKDKYLSNNKLAISVSLGVNLNIIKYFALRAEYALISNNEKYGFGLYYYKKINNYFSIGNYAQMYITDSRLFPNYGIILSINK